MKIEFTWEGPGSYFLIPAMASKGEKWNREPIHIATTGDIEYMLDEVRERESSFMFMEGEIWREGGIIYRDDIQESDRFLTVGGWRL